MTVKPFLYAALLLLTQCSKCKHDDPSPESQLPAATQTGANTFGCLVNGQVYLPSGNNGTANYAVLYEPGFQGGTLDIQTYRYAGSGTNTQQSIVIGGTEINNTGAYYLTAAGIGTWGMFFYDRSKQAPCDRFIRDNTTYKVGTLNITRLDLTAGIISGTFAFTLAQPGCDTIKVTQGRFDKKL